MFVYSIYVQMFIELTLLLQNNCLYALYDNNYYYITKLITLYFTIKGNQLAVTVQFITWTITAIFSPYTMTHF